MSNKFQKFRIGLKPKEKVDLASKAKTSVSYLSQVANGHRNAGKKTIEHLVGADSRISLSMFFEAA